MSTSDFENWDPVDDDNDEAPVIEKRTESSSELPLPIECSGQKKISESPIRSLQNSSRNSIPSVDNTALKSSPADPQLTALDPITGVNSPPTKNGTALNSVNQIIDSTKDSKLNDLKEIAETTLGEDESDASNTSFLNNMLTSFNLKNSVPPSANASSHSRALSESGVQSKPGIITYRKATPTKRSKRSVSTDSTHSPTSPLQQMQKPNAVAPEFNKKLYVEERFAGTDYHYALDERNAELHRIFKSIPEDDRLLDDFSCALSREFLFQGRLYVTETNLCFNSNLLGWVTHVVIAMKDITIIEKTSTAGLFPNGIAIETRLGRHQFVSFISRDPTFEFIKTVWGKCRASPVSEAVDLNSEAARVSSLRENLQRSQSDLVATTLSTETPFDIPPSRASMVSDNDAEIEEAILSVDDFTPTIVMGKQRSRKSGNDDDDESESESEDEGAIEDGSDSEESSQARTSSQKVYGLKSETGFEYDGPTFFQETPFLYDPEANNETVLAEVEFDAPPGVIYQLIFSSDKTDFLQMFLKGQNSSNLSTIPAFDQVNKDGQQYREYTYTKALNYAVGPKSTKCHALETVLTLDYENCINVVNTTKTPDVPSGNSFSVKTRYMMRWASATTSILRVSFWVDWTGGSWIKAMIDKSCKAGQVEATEQFIELLKTFVNDFTVESSTEVKQTPRKKQPQSRRVSRISNKTPQLQSTAAVVEEKSQNNDITVQKPGFFSGITVTNILLMLNLFFLLIVLAREHRILRLIEASNSSFSSGANDASINQMLSHFKTMFETEFDGALPLKNAAKGETRRLTVREWLNRHASSDETFDLDARKKKQHQRYMRYLMDQLIDGEVSLAETEEFLHKLDQLVGVVNDTTRKTGSANAAELKDVVKYLINT
ncbi:LADA_0C11870g1_1 [Lachancea dasiensis]|uniref:LADA_0C11870g1_1 n=1 Tax=Lachancea dasiensis TaxID=1072105 RepID=A0A1G4J1P0_9SACH|nr:LADA_0C11870g1_1 [Lachancea dasiensis]